MVGGRLPKESEWEDLSTFFLMTIKIKAIEL